MHTGQELSTMTEMLSLLLMPDNNFTLSEKGLVNLLHIPLPSHAKSFLACKKGLSPPSSSLGQGHRDIILFTLH